MSAPRKPSPVTAGVDLGGTKIQTVVLRKGKVAGTTRVLTPQTGVPAEVVEAIVGTIRASLDVAGSSVSELAGVGIGTPGEIDTEAGAVLLAANVPGFSERVELGSLVSQGLEGTTVTVGNDVSVGVLGEHKRGAGRPFRNLHDSRHGRAGFGHNAGAPLRCSGVTRRSIATGERRRA